MGRILDSLHSCCCCWRNAVIAANCVLEQDDLLLRPGQDAGPTDVYIHTHINDIVTINDAQQSFSSDVFIRIEGATHALPILAQRPAPSAWGCLGPELQIMNRRSVQNVREIRPLVMPTVR